MTDIAEHVSNLQTILVGEEALFLRMRDLLAREEAELIELDAETMASTLEDKRMLTEEGRLFADSRQQVVRELAAAMGLDAKGLKLADLIDALGEEGRALRPLHARLSALIESTRSLIDANQSFANRSLARVQDTLRLLGRSLPEEPGYGPGRRNAASSGRGRLVRQSI